MPISATLNRQTPLILIVADDPDLLQFTGSLVEQPAYQIETIADIENAVIAAQRTSRCAVGGLEGRPAQFRAREAHHKQPVRGRDCPFGDNSCRLGATQSLH